MQPSVVNFSGYSQSEASNLCSFKMEFRADNIIHDLRQAGFAFPAVERLCSTSLPTLPPDQVAALVRWLQREGTAAKNDKTLCANIHLCSCCVWETVLEDSRRRGALDTYIFESQLPQIYITTAQKCLDAGDLQNCQRLLEQFRLAVVAALRTDDRLLRSVGYVHGSHTVNELRLEWAEVWILLCLKVQKLDALHVLEQELDAWLFHLEASNNMDATFRAVLKVGAICQQTFVTGIVSFPLLLTKYADAALERCKVASDWVDLHQAHASILAMAGELCIRKNDMSRAVTKLLKGKAVLAEHHDEALPLYHRILQLLCWAQLSQMNDTWYHGPELDAAAWADLNAVLHKDSEYRLQLLNYCCENITRDPCRHVLEYAARLPVFDLLNNLAGLAICGLKCVGGPPPPPPAGTSAAAAPSPTPTAAAAAAAAPAARRRPTESDFEQILGFVLGTWKETHEKEKIEDYGVPDAYAELLEFYIQHMRWTDAIQWLQLIKAGTTGVPYKYFFIHFALVLLRTGQLKRALATLEFCESEEEEMKHSALLLRLHILVLMGDRDAALQAANELAEDKRLTAQEACALCSECFTDTTSRAPTEVVVELLALLLHTLTNSQAASPRNAIWQSFMGLPDASPPETLASSSECFQIPELIFIASMYIQKSVEIGCQRASAARLARFLKHYPRFPKENAPGPTRYLHAFCAAEGSRAYHEANALTDPDEKWRVYVESADLYSLAIRCSDSQDESITDSLLCASGVIAAARTRVVPCAEDPLQSSVESLGDLPLLSATNTLSQLQRILKQKEKKTKATENLLRLALLLEFEARCLLAKELIQGGSCWGAPAAGTQYVSPILLAQEAFEEERLGVVGYEMLFVAAIELADQDTVTWIAKAILRLFASREVRDFSVVAAAIRRAMCMERRQDERLGLMMDFARSSDKLIMGWPAGELQWICGNAWNQATALCYQCRPSEALPWMEITLLLWNRRSEAMAGESMEVLNEAYAQCRKKAEEERAFRELQSAAKQQPQQREEPEDSA